MSCLFDNYQRRINYMRISITDHCDLRCMYCTAYQVPRLSHDDILRYEEIEEIVKASAGLGIDSLRMTGGEPLMRPHVENLIELLKRVEGIKEISMTTNGTTLARKAAALRSAGLDRVNISLDSLKTDTFTRMTGRDKLHDVLAGIEAARREGLNPVKINTVILKGINDDEILDFAEKTKSGGWHVRFIEYMPFACDGSKNEGFSANRMVEDGYIRDTISLNAGTLEPVFGSKGSGPAKYYQLAGAEGTIGFIGAVTECFCHTCNRMRLTADGRLRPCLLEDDEVDIKTPLRAGATGQDLEALISRAASLKHEKHRLGQQVLPSGRQMWQIGG